MTNILSDSPDYHPRIPIPSRDSTFFSLHPLNCELSDEGKVLMFYLKQSQIEKIQ